MSSAKPETGRPTTNNFSKATTDNSSRYKLKEKRQPHSCSCAALNWLPEACPDSGYEPVLRRFCRMGRPKTVDRHEGPSGSHRPLDGYRPKPLLRCSGSAFLESSGQDRSSPELSAPYAPHALLASITKCTEEPILQSKLQLGSTASRSRQPNQSQA